MVRAAQPQHKKNHVWSPYRKLAVQVGGDRKTHGHERRVTISAGIFNSRTPPPQPRWPFGVQAWAWLACDLS